VLPAPNDEPLGFVADLFLDPAPWNSCGIEQAVFHFFLDEVDDSDEAEADIDADGTLTAGSAVREPVDLPSTATAAESAVDLFDFQIADGGTADNQALTLSQIVLHTAGTGPFRQVAFRLHGPDASHVSGTYSRDTNTLTFRDLSLSVADGENETYTVNAYYRDPTSLTERQTFVLSVDGDTDLTVDSGGTQMGTTTAVTNGTGSPVDITATQLVFTTQPAGSVSGSALTTQPGVTAQDAAGNTDTDFSETVTLSESSAGSLSNTTQAAVRGVAAFSGVTYTATAEGQSFTLTANDEDDTGRDLPTVAANAVTSDVVATQLVFTTQPAGSISGRALTTQPVVTAQDAAGNTDTDFSETITLSESSAGSLRNPTQAAVRGVARFRGVTYTATAEGQSFTLTANDEDGTGSDLPRVAANAVTLNVAPTLTDLATSVTFGENTVNAAQVIDGEVTVADEDSEDFDGGRLLVVYSSGGGSDDQLSVRHQGTDSGQIGFAGGKVTFGGTEIGTVPVSGAGSGVDGQSLIVTLTAGATPAAAAALIENLTYQNTAAEPAASRTLLVTVADGAGGLSPAVRVTIEVGSSVDLVAKTPFRFELDKGWNLVSLPVQVEDARVRALFPTAAANLAYDPEEGYAASAELVPGRGYWVFLPEKAAVLVEGQPVPELKVEVSTGWNLIGVGVEPLEVGALRVASADRLLLAFGFAGDFWEATSLQPGKGYWIYWFDESGGTDTLVLSGAPAAKPIAWLPPAWEAAFPAAGVLWARAGDQRRELRLGVPSRAVRPLPPRPPFGGLEMRVRVAGVETRQVPEVGRETEYEVLLQGEEIELGWDLPLAETGMWELVVDGQVFLSQPGSRIALNRAPGELRLRRTGSRPRAFALEENFPNPFNPSTTIRYAIEEGCRVRLRVYNLAGQRVRELVDQWQAPGWYGVGWDGRDEEGTEVGNGVYLYELRAGNRRSRRKMMLVE